MKKSELSYEQALSEMQQIVEDLENNKLPVEKMMEKVERASFLSNFCKSKLRNIEGKIEELYDKSTDS